MTRNAAGSSIFLLLASISLHAQDDMAGSRDHPDMARIQGTNIIGYAYSDYDEAEFVTAFADREFSKNRVGGKRTRIIYAAPGSMPVAAIWKNYGTVFTGLGEVVDVYNCAANECASNMGAAFVWAENNRVPVSFRNSRFMYAALSYRDQAYAYFTVTVPSKRFHVALYSAYLTGLQAPDVKGIRAIHLDIIEEADFEPTLQVVTAEEIAQGISEEGRVALYGIYFDFDSDALQAESAAALEAIAVALAADPQLKIYVVGHTDNQGDYAYNVDLSKRRAASVVRALVDGHDIAAARLVAVGVGPVSPVASNRSEDGMALNRRVELVEF